MYFVIVKKEINYNFFYGYYHLKNLFSNFLTWIFFTVVIKK